MCLVFKVIMNFSQKYLSGRQYGAFCHHAHVEHDEIFSQTFFLFLHDVQRRHSYTWLNEARRKKSICTLWSKRNKILIKKRTQSSNVHTFSALIYGECGGNYAGVRGHIASPGFPFNDYPPEQDCEWVIEVPTNLYVEVRRKCDESICVKTTACPLVFLRN